MFENIPVLLKVFDTASKALSGFSDWRSNSKGDVRALVEELKENSRYFWLIIEEGVPIEDIIDKLTIEEYDRLNKEGFNFNLLQKKEIDKYPSLHGTSLSSWQGKQTEQLVTNIYDKIKDLKTKYPLAKNSKKIQWKLRVKNAQTRILLLLRHAGR